jgi:FKBP-type peptidyl-prolyl cis-trans isomerase
LLFCCVAAGAVAGAQAHKIPPVPETARPAVTLRSGLKYIDIVVGKGVKAERGRVVRILYTGWVDKTEVMFDFRDKPNEPLAFRVGAPDILPGLSQGVAGMRVGGKRRLLIPARLGHGGRSTTLIPANSDLTYDVELVSVSRPGV